MARPGLAVQLLTPWFAGTHAFTYLEYDGNKGTVTISPRVERLKGQACPHHPPEETGDPFFDIRQHQAPRGVTVPSRPSPSSWTGWLRRVLKR
jgi:hypothetical protein